MEEMEDLMSPYVITRRNNRGKTRDELVLAEDRAKALGVARANNTNPFWPPIAARPATLADLWDALSQHDWHFHMSDDHRAYSAGQRRHDELTAAAKALGPEGERLLTAWLKDLDHPPARPS